MLWQKITPNKFCTPWEISNGNPTKLAILNTYYIYLQVVLPTSYQVSASDEVLFQKLSDGFEPYEFLCLIM